MPQNETVVALMAVIGYSVFSSVIQHFFMNGKRRQSDKDIERIYNIMLSLCTSIQKLTAGVEQQLKMQEDELIFLREHNIETTNILNHLDEIRRHIVHV